MDDSLVDGLVHWQALVGPAYCVGCVDGRPEEAPATARLPLPHRPRVEAVIHPGQPASLDPTWPRFLRRSSHVTLALLLDLALHLVLDLCGCVMRLGQAEVGE